MKREKSLIIYSILLNLTIAVLTAVSVAATFEGDIGRWREVLKYFTNESNIFCGVAALILAVDGIIALKKGRSVFQRIPLLLKYAGTVLVTITFLVVFCFLSFLFGGLGFLLSGANFYLHFAGPVLSIVSFTAFDRGIQVKIKHILFSILFVALYGGMYFVNVVLLKRWEDFYGFNRNGRWYLSIILMGLAAFAIGLILKFLHNKCDRSHSAEEK